MARIMLNQIKDFFERHLAPPEAGSGVPGESAKRLAVAALLLEISHADYEVAPEERAAVAEQVRERFDLSQEQLAELLAAAEAERAQATDYFQFTSLINQSHSAGQKLELVELLWCIAFADGRLDKYEEHLVRRLSELLYVPHKDFIAAKLRVRGEQS